MFSKDVAKFRERFTQWLNGDTHGLSGSAVETFRELLAQLDDQDARLEAYDRRLEAAARQDERAKRLWRCRRASAK